MALKAKDNSLEGASGVAQADTRQPVSVQGTPGSEEIAARSIARKHGVDFIKLSETQLSPHIVRLLPQELVSRHNVIAVKFEEDTLYVAMTNPLDLPTLDEINLVTGFNVKPVVAIEREIIQAISQHYGAEQMSKQDLVDVRFGYELTEEADEHLEDLDLSSEAGQVVRLINSIIKLDKQKNDMNEVIREVHKTIASSVKERAIDFCLKLEDNLPKVEFDSDKIVQVLTNLLGNAVKFTEKGSIAITTSKGENTILVSVSDTGRGIKKEDLPRLFHEFEQLTEGRERKTGGTGLGLVISKEIIRQHGGKIWAESEYDKGTTFHFVLPIEERRRIWRKES